MTPCNDLAIENLEYITDNVKLDEASFIIFLYSLRNAKEQRRACGIIRAAKGKEKGYVIGLEHGIEFKNQPISRYHRSLGYDVPIADIDFIEIGNADDLTPLLMVEYKEKSSSYRIEQARATDGRESYQSVPALRRFADKARVPFILTKYSISQNPNDDGEYIVWAINDLARKLIPEEGIKLTENQYFAFLKNPRPMVLDTYKYAKLNNGNFYHDLANRSCKYVVAERNDCFKPFKSEEDAKKDNLKPCIYCFPKNQT